MNRKPSRGITGYIILLATLLLVAILLNGGLNQTVNRRIEYPRLLEMIKPGCHPEQFPCRRHQNHGRSAGGFSGTRLRL